MNLAIDMKPLDLNTPSPKPKLEASVNQLMESEVTTGSRSSWYTKAMTMELNLCIQEETSTSIWASSSSHIFL